MGSEARGQGEKVAVERENANGEAEFMRCGRRQEWRRGPGKAGRSF